jgi:hypothetical protein
MHVVATSGTHAHVAASRCVPAAHAAKVSQTGAGAGAGTGAGVFGPPDDDPLEDAWPGDDEPPRPEWLAGVTVPGS